LFICFVEFLTSVSFLREENWKEVSKFESEKNLEEKFVCVVCFCVEFFLSKNVKFDCQFCDSILIFFLLLVFEFVAFSIFSSILKNFVSENQSSVSFRSVKKKKSEIEKKIVFISCSFVCFLVNSSIKNLFAFVFFVFESSFMISFEKSSVFLNSKKCEIVQKKKKFLEKSTIVDDDVTSFCATRDSNFLSQNKNNRVSIIVEEEEEKCASSAKSMRFCINSEKSLNWLRFFVIDFAFDCLHVEKIKDLLCIISFVETEQKHQKESCKKKKKKRCLLKSSINIEKIN
jgi:hypothetical protein